MPVSITIGEEEISCPDDSNSAIVEAMLRNGYGPGFLKQGGMLVTSAILPAGDYEYHLTNPPTPQAQGKLFNSFNSLLLQFQLTLFFLTVSELGKTEGQ